jgi:ribose 5-phosphate isomerase A
MDRVALTALGEVKSGMRLGLGTGRAAEAFIRRLAERVHQGLEVRCVVTSVRSERLARELGMSIETLDDLPELDIAFDGADECTPALDLVKGLGGALLRERVVARAASRFVVLITPDKRVPKLGTRAPVPVEVVPFAKTPVGLALERLGGRPALRAGEQAEPYLTDNGNVVLDTHFAPIDDPAGLDARIRSIAGVVDNGLFLRMTSCVLVGGKNEVERLERVTA